MTPLQEAAADMHDELEASALEVILVPADDYFRDGYSMKRVAIEQNPGWYRDLCALYLSSAPSHRRRCKLDTCIKRRETLQALSSIADGRHDQHDHEPPTYVRRLMPFVLQRAEEYQQQALWAG